MGGMTVGPLAFSAERAPVIAGLLVLLLAAGLLSRRAGGWLSHWATAGILSGLLAARLGFVLQPLDLFRAAPLSAFAFWQGGFAPVWGLAGFGLASLWLLGRRPVLIVPALVSLVLAGTAWNAVRQLSAPEALMLPEAVVLSDLSGTEIRTADWVGQPLVINLWASWCPPCRREMPMMAEIAQTRPGLPILFVNQGEGPGTIRTYLVREQITVAPLLDHGSQLMRHFNAQGLPATLFIDAQGHVTQAHLGEISRAALLSGMDALQKPSP